MFKGNFYDQVDGVAMGSPLAPVLANLFMGHHENIWLDQYGDSEVLFYRGYVDDTFCLFHSERDATLFFNYINNQHPNIRFTIDLRLVFTTFKVRNLFNVKDAVPEGLRTCGL